MNVYDFDGTIYKKDSSVELYKFVINKNPIILFQCLPRQVWAMLKYKLKLLTKEQMKEIYFCFLKYLKNERVIDEFVEKEMKNINKWYYEKHKEDDLIISASPIFLIKKFAQRLDIKNILATEVEMKTGRFLSKNCYGEEKVRKFNCMFPNERIEQFYSDSKSDLPLAKYAKMAYFVDHGTIKEWKIK